MSDNGQTAVPDEGPKFFGDEIAFARSVYTTFRDEFKFPSVASTRVLGLMAPVVFDSDVEKCNQAMDAAEAAINPTGILQPDDDSCRFVSSLIGRPHDDKLLPLIKQCRVIPCAILAEISPLLAKTQPLSYSFEFSYRAVESTLQGIKDGKNAGPRGYLLSALQNLFLPACEHIEAMRLRPNAARTINHSALTQALRPQNCIGFGADPDHMNDLNAAILVINGHYKENQQKLGQNQLLFLTAENTQPKSTREQPEMPAAPGSSKAAMMRQKYG